MILFCTRVQSTLSTSKHRMDSNMIQFAVFMIMFLSLGKAQQLGVNGRLDNLKNLIESCPCNSADTAVEPEEQDDFIQAGCATSAPAVLTEGFTLDATQPGTWPANGFCRVYAKEVLDARNYVISADLFNVNSKRGPSFGHLGLFYNAQDINNYDFVYLRFHNAKTCYQTGQVINGALNWQGSQSSSCTNGMPSGATWFNVKVAVNGGTAHVYRDNVFIVEVTPRFFPRGSGGVLTANGFINLGHFKNFKISTLKKL